MHSISLRKYIPLVIFCIASLFDYALNPAQASSLLSIHPDKLTLFDSSRNRIIPIAIYNNDPNADHKIPVIISHGYGANHGGNYLHYSFIANALAEKGYFVVSIQHELQTDELIPDSGNPQIVRRPIWERGVQNILFVLGEMKRKYTNLNYEKLILIGHSNGGDMSMLFANEYPLLVDKVISLDNRRMAFPRTSNPKIYSIRSNDFPADEGVLPDESERKKFNVTIDNSEINHNQMSDFATEAERKYLIRKIMEYVISL